MAKVYLYWYTFAMTYYDDIYEIAVDQNYMITAREAKAAGIPGIELAKLSQRGKLENLGYGVYRLTRYVPSEADPYAVAVALAGPGARLHGESVIAMLGLAPTNPAFIYVESPRRVRRKLEDGVVLKKANADEPITTYMGVPSQTVKHAILSARKTMMDDRLREAASAARDEGYLTRRELADLSKEMSWT